MLPDKLCRAPSFLDLKLTLYGCRLCTHCLAPPDLSRFGFILRHALIASGGSVLSVFRL